MSHPLWLQCRSLTYQICDWIGRGSTFRATSPRLAILGLWAHRITVLLIFIVTLQAGLLVLGAWRNDIAIEKHMGIAEAEVLSAGPRRSTIEFVTPDRVTYRPELGVLYPSELATGMRIYVEYDRQNPDLVRVQHRNAVLAVVPAASLALTAWIIGGGILVGIDHISRRTGSVLRC